MDHFLLCQAKLFVVELFNNYALTPVIPYRGNYGSALDGRTKLEPCRGNAWIESIVYKDKTTVLLKVLADRIILASKMAARAGKAATTQTSMTITTTYDEI